ncbi:MAG TPA: acyl-CoA dehydrogenase family protein [Acidimicrobiia bacterium]|jgi:alkylation response protein AidB-like acyl-CoA dehydrogenase|nr:acyl-CoA dehydrogenase family protein [Acidimicrobiia bacterium]
MEPFDSPEEAQFRAQARAWLEANADRPPAPPIAPSAIVAEWTPAEEVQKLAEARAWQKLKFDAGWAGIAWPPAYGGRGRSIVEHNIFSAEESHFDIPHDALVVGLAWCGPAVLLLGNEEQRQRLLPPLLSGSEVWCQLFSEPGSGSDLASLSTKAVHDGDEWVISGQKVWTTFAHLSDWGLCIARTDPELPPHRGLSAFVVDMRSPGVETRQIRQMTGSANFNEVFLNEVRVPDSNRIGEVGDGWRVVITTFMFERTAVLSIGATVADAFTSLLAARAPGDGSQRDRFLRVIVAGKALGYTQLRMATALSQGRMPGPEGSVAKLVGTTLLADLYDQALDVLGADGLLADGDAPYGGEWQDAFLGTPGLRIGGGTDQIQRNIIAERILGLPKDWR